MAGKKVRTIELKALELQETQLKLQLKSQENIQMLVEKGLPILEKYYQTKLERLETPKVQWTIIGFLVILILVTLGAGIMTYLGKLDQGNFTFLLGTLLGVSVTMLKEVVMPSE
ncbi:hypothetical protein HYV43_00455 [Candidatus Micrarchaeota archaeon]|nr:hypothetical protein [Candidatus Micrarchaeota archaeon]